MKKIIYNVRLLTDVIVSSGSASEGTKHSLSYIPGIKFLGIAASKLYDYSDIKKTLDLFHNGTVRFGDAHIMGSKHRSLPVPAGWYHEKGGSIEGELFLSGKIIGSRQVEKPGRIVRLKEVKDPWYFTTEGEAVRPVTGFSLKSAYDSDKKTSKDAQLFGYHYLAKGSDWQFTVEFDDISLADMVDRELQGIHRIGRSRSAEFGLVEIARAGEDDPSDRLVEKGEVILFAESNLCFYDELGMSTPRPEPDQLRLPEGSQILWDRSVIRTRIYETWNRKRYNRDADRIIIEKGSVIVADASDSFSTALICRGVGSHTAEGFGKLIIDPPFFRHDKGKLPRLKKYESANRVDRAVGLEAPVDRTLLNYLNAASKKETAQLSIDEKVNDFIHAYGARFAQVSPSQWGQIRKYAKYSDSRETLLNLLFDEKTGYLRHGRSEELWRSGKRGEILKRAIEEKSEYSVEFALKLAAEMAKRKNSND